MSKTLKFIKANLFLLAVITVYLLLSIISPKTAVKSAQNSIYYIKEMLMIMPVIFVLTALLDSFVPKKTIIKFLGRDSKIKGTLFAFLLGSISAGPIYAAFPVCVMLHKKGASIKNIIIILSSWAVVKIPMLLNEAKFLGLNFMALRWVLTIVSILIFSAIADRIIKDNDIPNTISNKIKGIHINTSACMGCSVCTQKYPQLFVMSLNKATLIGHCEIDMDKLTCAIESCPVSAISINE